MIPWINTKSMNFLFSMNYSSKQTSKLLNLENEKLNFFNSESSLCDIVSLEGNKNSSIMGFLMVFDI